MDFIHINYFDLKPKYNELLVKSGFYYKNQ